MNNLINEIKKILPSIHGWCSPDKAIKFVEIIINTQPNICLEIGVFGGSSYIPQAMALQCNKKGIIYGIDPWRNDTALEEMISDEHKKWWGELNLEKIYQDFLLLIKKYNLEDCCKIIRDKSENVSDQFQDESICLLHIDGNHSQALSYKDAVNYLPKLKVGGICFFDDIFWKEGGEVTTRKAILHLLERCKKIDVINNDCLALQKIK